MGTQGLVVYKYNGVYYMFYNHFDSYPSYLGNLIINNIKQIIEENKYETLKEIITNMAIYDDEVNGSTCFDDIFLCAQYPDSYCYRTSDYEPSCDTLIEYIYTIDFDNNTLEIKTNEYLNYQTYTLNLFNIPTNYIEVINHNIRYYNLDSVDSLDEQLNTLNIH